MANAWEEHVRRRREQLKKDIEHRRKAEGLHKNLAEIKRRRQEEIKRKELEFIKLATKAGAFKKKKKQ